MGSRPIQLKRVIDLRETITESNATRHLAKMIFLVTATSVRRRSHPRAKAREGWGTRRQHGVYLQSARGFPSYCRLLQLCVLCFGLFQDGNVGIGVFPERQKILVSGECAHTGGIGIRALRGFRLQSIRTSHAQMR